MSAGPADRKILGQKNGRQESGGRKRRGSSLRMGADDTDADQGERQKDGGRKILRSHDPGLSGAVQKCFTDPDSTTLITPCAERDRNPGLEDSIPLGLETCA